MPEIDIIKIHKINQLERACLEVELKDKDFISRYFINVISFKELLKKYNKKQIHVERNPILIVHEISKNSLVLILMELYTNDSFFEVMTPLSK